MPETTLASPSLRRLTRTGKPDWERYLDTLEYNMPAWNASNWIVKHNIKIIGHVKHIHDYETGKRADPPPFTLPELVNPKLNSRDSGRRNAGLDRLRYLFASMKRYEPGHAADLRRGHPGEVLALLGNRAAEPERRPWQGRERTQGDAR